MGESEAGASGVVERSPPNERSVCGRGGCAKRRVCGGEVRVTERAKRSVCEDERAWAWRVCEEERVWAWRGDGAYEAERT